MRFNSPDLGAWYAAAALTTAAGVGVIFDSLRHAGGTNIAAHRPRNVLDVIQTDHYALTVEAGAARIVLRRLVGWLASAPFSRRIAARADRDHDPGKISGGDHDDGHDGRPER